MFNKKLKKSKVVINCKSTNNSWKRDSKIFIYQGKDGLYYYSKSRKRDKLMHSCEDADTAFEMVSKKNNGRL